MISRDEAFKIGDRVKWFDKNAVHGLTTRWRFGVVTRVSEASITVKPLDGGKAKVLRVSRYGRRYPFVDKATPHEAALQAWKAKKPRALLLRSQDYAYGIELAITLGPNGERIDEAIADLIAFKDWLVVKPKPPTKP